MNRIIFKPYDKDSLVMVLVLDKEQLNKIGIDETSAINICFYEGELRLFKLKDIHTMGRES